MSDTPVTVRVKGPVGFQTLTVATDLAPGRRVLHPDGPAEVVGRPWHDGTAWVVSVEFTRTHVCRFVALDALFLGI